ncbi:hypothetical protein WR25_18483 [Diploscapter pachys]|uniref:Uncharacterized protein n=1 Tax=Diploscapter pachys TaxID=2018661 RepID=A0A2A2M5N8_9BILA|nr:hypothetical protein WR25_18483 [Diploscapter pachys]
MGTDGVQFALPLYVQRAAPANRQVTTAQAVLLMAQLLSLQAIRRRRTTLQRHRLLMSVALQVQAAACRQPQAQAIAQGPGRGRVVLAQLRWLTLQPGFGGGLPELRR